jgi:hypothetical protein
VLTSCFGCGLLANNQWLAGQVFLIAAWLILVPLFGFMLRAYRATKRVVRRKEERQEEELAALSALAGRLGEGSVSGEQGSEVSEEAERG